MTLLLSPLGALGWLGLIRSLGWLGSLGLLGALGTLGSLGELRLKVGAAGCSVEVFLAPTSLSMTALGLGGSGRRSQRSFRGEQLVGLQRGRTSSRRGVLLETL